jgi:hypothetical protein
MKIYRLLIEQNYFRFQDTVYLQKEGLTMGAPTSTIFSEVYLQYIENTEIYYILLNPKVEGYSRYVDDIVYKENRTNINDILDRFNNIRPRMQFTLQQEQDKRINLLDVTIIKDKNRLLFDIHRKPNDIHRKPNDIYRKPKTTDTIIPSDSFHPMGYKLTD